MINESGDSYNYLFDIINTNFKHSPCINCNKTIDWRMDSEFKREYVDYYCFNCNKNKSVYSIYISKLHCFICTIFIHDIVFYYDYALLKHNPRFHLRVKYVYSNSEINITFNEQQQFIDHIINIKDNFKYFNRLKSIV